MTATKEFDLGEVLSVTTGRLVSRTHMNGIYKILGFMTGEELYTHQLPRAMRECAPVLLSQHPQLKDLDVPVLTPENFQTWLETQEARFGKTLPVSPLPIREPQYDTPIADAIEMMGDPTKVMVVEP